MTPKEDEILHCYLRLLSEKTVYSWEELVPYFPELTWYDMYGGPHKMSPFPYKCSWALHHLRENGWATKPYPRDHPKYGGVDITEAGRKYYDEQNTDAMLEELRGM